MNPETGNGIISPEILHFNPKFGKWTQLIPTDYSKRALKALPYAAILSTPAIWAVWIASIGNFFCVNMMFLFSPKYLSTGNFHYFSEPSQRNKKIPFSAWICCAQNRNHGCSTATCTVSQQIAFR